LLCLPFTSPQSRAPKGEHGIPLEDYAVKIAVEGRDNSHARSAAGRFTDWLGHYSGTQFALASVTPGLAGC